MGGKNIYFPNSEECELNSGANIVESRFHSENFFKHQQKIITTGKEYIIEVELRSYYIMYLEKNLFENIVCIAVIIVAYAAIPENMVCVWSILDRYGVDVSILISGGIFLCCLRIVSLLEDIRNNTRYIQY